MADSGNTAIDNAFIQRSYDSSGNRRRWARKYETAIAPVRASSATSNTGHTRSGPSVNTRTGEGRKTHTNDTALRGASLAPCC